MNQNDFLNQNMPIFETAAEDQDTSKRILHSLVIDQDDFELQIQLTPRLSPRGETIVLPININQELQDDAKLTMILEQNFNSQDTFKLVSHQSEEINSKSFLILDENVILIENQPNQISNEKAENKFHNYITRSQTIPELQNLNYK